MRHAVTRVGHAVGFEACRSLAGAGLDPAEAAEAAEAMADFRVMPADAHTAGPG
ncbi:MAG: hypothetical protein ACODAE_06870 [Gemmatimonadota bacterium]